MFTEKAIAFTCAIILRSFRLYRMKICTFAMEQKTTQKLNLAILPNGTLYLEWMGTSWIFVSPFEYGHGSCLLSTLFVTGRAFRAFDLRRDNPPGGTINVTLLHLIITLSRQNHVASSSQNTSISPPFILFFIPLIHVKNQRPGLFPRGKP